jgi:hypothetical protein
MIRPRRAGGAWRSECVTMIPIGGTMAKGTNQRKETKKPKKDAKKK